METSTVEEILSYLCDDLGGTWLIAGGALVRLEFDASRGTEDVDLMNMGHAELSEVASRNALFQWLMKRGLGPEWVNGAMEPFVREAEGWEEELVVLRQGRRGSVFRPNLTLFVYLKLRRGTEIDFQDVQAAVSKCPEGFSEKRFHEWKNEAVRKRFLESRLKLGI